MKGQLITLLFTPEEPDFTLPQLNGSSSRHDDQHVLETSYVEVAN
jgi:hypothetical protein